MCAHNFQIDDLQSGVVYNFEGICLSVCLSVSLYVCLSDDNFSKALM